LKCEREIRRYAEECRYEIHNGPACPKAQHYYVFQSASHAGPICGESPEKKTALKCHIPQSEEGARKCDGVILMLHAKPPLNALGWVQ